MKIHQIPLGTRFTYQGQTYVKSGPMLATSESGGQAVIPKYAVLTVDDPKAGQSALVADQGKLLNAFDAFYTTCQRLVPAEQQAVLAAARDTFLKSL